ncbi:hypothetical protein A4X09_0g3954 [Tilletia walkeri]|uniref:Uncharacterized protein n=1 Tax=Tilletia walkeri TaxID=117179 RepID=A0A8X7T4F5_9BASI|nr:hypothetical protein A4X09_0g3954 [Tilletia walkeri]
MPTGLLAFLELAASSSPALAFAPFPSKPTYLHSSTSIRSVMIPYRNRASRSESTNSAQHDGHFKYSTDYAQSGQAHPPRETSDGFGQDYSAADSSNSHEPHPLAHVRSLNHHSGSSHTGHQQPQQHLQQGHSAAFNPASTASSFSHDFGEVGPGLPPKPPQPYAFFNTAPGAGYKGPGPRPGLPPLSDSATASLIGTDHDIGAHYPDVSIFHDHPEDDDWLHDDRGVNDLSTSYRFCSFRGLVNVGFLLGLCASLLALFVAWPVLFYINTLPGNTLWGPRKTIMYSEGPTWINVLDANGAAQRVMKSPLRGLIDQDTPASAMTKMSSDGKRKMKLVFSDEFNEDGRTFFEGDDPYWTAVDLHYWGTKDFEWYSPLGATTKDGALRITFSEQPINNLNFKVS